MRLLIGALFAFSLSAETIAPIGIVRGEMVEWQGVKNVGTLTVKSSVDGETYVCAVDNYTYLERESQRIVPAALTSGEKLEIIADRKPVGKCYARTVRVTRAKVSTGSWRLAVRNQRSPMLEALYPRGNITYSGVVVRLAPGVMVVRTRHDGEQALLLRQDTRFLDSGFASSAESLAVNKRVFVRCGRNLENEIEVYQVIWGEIAGPHRE